MLDLIRVLKECLGIYREMEIIDGNMENFIREWEFIKKVKWVF